jgi:hypothetical protein
MNVLPAEVMGRALRKSLDRRVVIQDPEAGPVTVRWQLGREQPWRCSDCGPMTDAECQHTFAAGLVLAEQLLGLTRLPEYEPRGTNR